MTHLAEQIYELIKDEVPYSRDGLHKAAQALAEVAARLITQAKAPNMALESFQAGVRVYVSELMETH